MRLLLLPNCSTCVLGGGRRKLWGRKASFGWEEEEEKNAEEGERERETQVNGEKSLFSLVRIK